MLYNIFDFLFNKESHYSKPSLIPLQLIRIETVKNEKFCSGQLERLKPHKKISKTGLSWMKESLDFSF
jgi:hypothetical protein